MPAYDARSAFASCPAATGEADPPCTHFPDGAHRCTRPRDHVRNESEPVDRRIMHTCTCGAGWCSLLGGLDDLFKLFRKATTS